MEEIRQSRKLDHIKYALMQDNSKESIFKDINFIPTSLPNLAFDEINCRKVLFKKELSMPLMINAITGGNRETYEINLKLAETAEKTGIAMAVGSQKAALDDSSLTDTYQIVRKRNPKGLIFANLSAVSPLEDVQKAVEMIEADAVQLFLNVPQELFMEEGDRDFKGILENIASVQSKISIPVVVKEVGFGISAEAIKQLRDNGIHYIDVGGKGGTNFIEIENSRSSFNEARFVLDWGIPTGIALVEAVSKLPDMNFFASGGIRSPLDVAKALVIGAGMTGISGYFLKILMEQSKDALENEIRLWERILKKVMLMLGAKDLQQLKNCPFVVTGHSFQWLSSRGIDLKRFAQRKL